MIFADVHCHLDLCKNIPEIIARARANNIKAMISNGLNPKSNREVLELAGKHKEVRAALGIYPIDALSLNDFEIEKELKFIMTQRKNVLAIGEVGMDFKNGKEQADRQTYIFKKIISFAREIEKPLIIHSRKSEEESIKILEDAGAKKVIMHCFSGKKKAVEKICANGWFLTIPTSVVYNKQFMDIAKEVPLGHLLCETDSPFLHPFKEKNNEPFLVIESYKMIAKLKEIPLEDVSRMIALNYKKIFGEELE